MSDISTMFSNLFSQMTFLLFYLNLQRSNRQISSVSALTMSNDINRTRTSQLALAQLIILHIYVKCI